MGLFGPIWMTTNTSKLNKVREEIGKIKDVDKLKEIAIKAPLPETKCSAAFNIGDENILKELYFDKDIASSHFQMFLISEIRNKGIINEIALVDAKNNDYYVAYNKVVDDSILSKIILGDNYKITNSNYGENLLLKSIKSVNNLDDLNKLIKKYDDDNIVRLLNNQKDKLEGVKAYLGLCPECHKEIRYDIYYDFYDDKQKEKPKFICGCSKYNLNSFKKCEIKKIKKDLEGNYLNICYNCGLPLEHEVNNYRKCMCGLGKYYLPISIKIEKDE